VADPDARSLAQARQMATAAALRLVRRAASDAADAASGRRPARRTTAPGSQLLEAVLEVLPPARHAHREEVPKGAGNDDDHDDDDDDDDDIFVFIIMFNKTYSDHLYSLVIILIIHILFRCLYIVIVFSVTTGIIKLINIILLLIMIIK